MSRDFVFEFISGSETTLEEVQAEMLEELSRLLTKAIRAGIENGSLVVVDGQLRPSVEVERDGAGAVNCSQHTYTNRETRP